MLTRRKMKRKRIYNFLLFILIFYCILSIVLLNPISDLDEIWNYNFARNMADGLIPYKDFSMLQMPLLPLIVGIILKIFTNQLIVSRILAALLCSSILYIVYKLFTLLNIKKESAIILTFLISYLFKDLFCIDYNYATLLITLIIIYYEIKSYKKSKIFIQSNKKTDFFLGILAGLTIILKQTTGIFICIALLGNKLLFVKNKEEFKTYLKSFAFRIIGICVPVICMIVYLLVTNAFRDFISYTIKGVSGFSNYISYKNLINWSIIGTLSVLVPFTFVYAWIKSVILDKDKTIYFLLVYGLAMFVVCFPISDKIHFLIGALPTIMLILYEICKLINYVFNKIVKKEIIRYIIFALIYYAVCVMILTIIYLSYLNYNYYFKNIDKTSKLNHFHYIPISKNLETEINEIDKFINNNQDVKILDASAAIYMIPIDQYNKNYDMLLKGNLGENGENKIIEEIANYLILKDKFNKNWQTPLNIIDYVKNNKKKIGEIAVYDIYE